MFFDIPAQYLEEAHIYELLEVNSPSYIQVIAKEKGRAQECLVAASKYFDISPFIMQAVKDHENGEIGSANGAAGGSKDYGPYQINTVFLDELNQQHNISWKSLSYSACINAFVGGSILKQRIKLASNVWEGVGNYHYNIKKSPLIHYSYRLKVLKVYRSLLKDKMSFEKIEFRNKYKSKTDDPNYANN